MTGTVYKNLCCVSIVIHPPFPWYAVTFVRSAAYGFAYMQGAAIAERVGIRPQVAVVGVVLAAESWAALVALLAIPCLPPAERFRPRPVRMISTVAAASSISSTSNSSRPQAAHSSAGILCCEARNVNHSKAFSKF